jgi:hypothetical protein
MKEELDEQLRVLGFNVQHGVMDQEEERSRPITTPRTIRSALELISGQRCFFVILWGCHFMAELGLIST